MKPYSGNPVTKGISGRRKSSDSAHRRRSLRVDKKAARRSAYADIRKWARDSLDQETMMAILGGGIGGAVV